MDPVTIVIVVSTVVIAVVCTVIFKMATKETSFEEAYGQSARRLLTEDKAAKAKPKTVKTKKGKNVKADQEENQEVQEVPETSVKVVETSQANEPVPVLTEDKPVQLKPKTVKTKKGKNVKADQEENQEVPEISASVKVPETSQLPEENHHTTLTSQTAQKDPRLQQLSQEVETLRAELAKKAAGGEEANAFKAEIQKIKVEYADLSKAYRDMTGSKSVVENELAGLKKERAELDRNLKQMKDEVAAQQKKVLKCNADLKAQQDKYELFESSVRTKVAETVQLREENRRFAMLASQAAQKDTLIQQKDTLLAQKDALLQQLSQEYEALESSIRTNVAENQQEVNKLRSELANKSAGEEEANELKAEIQKIKVEYAELSQAYRDMIGLKSVAENELAGLKKERAEVDRNLKQMKDEVAAQQNKVLKCNADLKAQQDKYELFESSVRAKVAETVQLHEENRRLAVLASQVAQKDTLLQQLSQEYEALESSIRTKVTENQAEIVVDSTQNNTTSTSVDLNGSSHHTSLINANGKAAVIPTIEKLNDTSHSDTDTTVQQFISSSVEPLTVAPTAVGDAVDRQFKIEWPVVHWKDAPAEILICSNWWGWTEHQPMTKSAEGFTYYLDSTDKSGTPEREKFLFKFIVDGTWQCSDRYPIVVDENGIKNNYLTFAS